MSVIYLFHSVIYRELGDRKCNKSVFHTRAGEFITHDLHACGKLSHLQIRPYFILRLSCHSQERLKVEVKTW